MSMEEVGNVVLVATPLQLLSVGPSRLTKNPKNNIEFFIPPLHRSSSACLISWIWGFRWEWGPL